MSDDFLGDIADTFTSTLRTVANAKAAQVVADSERKTTKAAQPTALQPSGRPDPATPASRNYALIGFVAVLSVIGIVVLIVKRR